jgi:hypothetical protein
LLLLVVVVFSSGRGLVRIVYERRDTEEKMARTCTDIGCPSAKVEPAKLVFEGRIEWKIKVGLTTD